MHSISHISDRQTQSDTQPIHIEACVLLVPVSDEMTSDVWNFIISSSLFNIWLTSVLAFTILRWICRKIVFRLPPNFTYLFFDTFGQSFGTGGNGNYVNHAERILVFSIALFSMLASALFSGGLLVQFTLSPKQQQFTKLEDLAYENSKLQVLLSKELGPTEMHMTNLKMYVLI